MAKAENSIPFSSRSKVFELRIHFCSFCQEETTHSLTEEGDHHKSQGSKTQDDSSTEGILMKCLACEAFTVV
ncbi:MAG: hypothetical protein V4714_19260 [Bacteroidota bacterium]